MRHWIKLVEARHSNRLWIGPQGQVADCDAEDCSHAGYVVAHAADFDLPAGVVSGLQAFWEERGEEFDLMVRANLFLQGGVKRARRASGVP